MSLCCHCKTREAMTLRVECFQCEQEGIKAKRKKRAPRRPRVRGWGDYAYLAAFATGRFDGGKP